jgi:hypothetical protein
VCSSDLLVTVEFPSTLNAIERLAFQNCLRLATIEFGKNSELGEIGEAAFAKTAIVCVSLPQTAANVHPEAFDAGTVVRRI